MDELDALVRIDERLAALSAEVARLAEELERQTALLAAIVDELRAAGGTSEPARRAPSL